MIIMIMIIIIIIIIIIIFIIITISSITIIITDFKTICFGMTLDDTCLDKSPAGCDIC